MSRAEHRPQSAKPCELLQGGRVVMGDLYCLRRSSLVVQRDRGQRRSNHCFLLSAGPGSNTAGSSHRLYLHTHSISSTIARSHSSRRTSHRAAPPRPSSSFRAYTLLNPLSLGLNRLPLVLDNLPLRLCLLMVLIRLGDPLPPSSSASDRPRPSGGKERTSPRKHMLTACFWSLHTPRNFISGLPEWQSLRARMTSAHSGFRERERLGWSSSGSAERGTYGGADALLEEGASRRSEV